MRTYEAKDEIKGREVSQARPRGRVAGLPGNRKQRRTIRKVGAFFGKAEFVSVRVERADGRCIGRKLVRK